MLSQMIHPRLDLNRTNKGYEFNLPYVFGGDLIDAYKVGMDAHARIEGVLVDRHAPICMGGLTTFQGCPVKYNKYIMPPPPEKPMLALPVAHCDASILPAITQSELDATSLRRRLDQISDLRDDKSERKFGQFEPTIPPEHMASVQRFLHVTPEQDHEFTIKRRKEYFGGISVDNAIVNDDGDIVKEYLYPDEAMMLAYRQYKLAQIGLSPPVIELPDMLLNCSGIEGTGYIHRVRYISKLAHVFKCHNTTASYGAADDTFAVECRDRMCQVLDMLGIYWSDSHTGNLGIYNEQIVIIDTGAMVSEQPPHWERIAQCYKDKDGNDFSECKL